MNTITSLKQLLISAYPWDVMMPVKKGTKQPMFKHKEGSWTWDKFNQFTKQPWLGRSPDVCIVLHDLCVVDVDDHKLVEGLCKTFPILHEVPCEQTTKGCHFWFVRSAFADAMGYFDGARQRQESIDFKSITSTGTGGIVVVAPSNGKTWVRPLWNTQIPEIPDDLLDAIAVPHHQTINAILLFEDGLHIELMNNRWMRSMTYFDPFLDGSFETDTILVPCCRDIFRHLMFTLDNDDFPVPDPSRELLIAMTSLADKLGLSTKVMCRVLHGNPVLQLDMFTACPDWWSTIHEENEWRRNGACNDGILIPVDRRLASNLVYETHDVDSRWLFSECEPVTCIPGEHVLCEDPSQNLEENLPDIVKYLLRKYHGHLVLAGGSVLGLVALFADEGADYDMFVVGLNEKDASILLNNIRDTYLAKTDIIRTGRALTLLFEDITVQIIFRTYSCVGQVLVGFDVPPCKVCAYAKSSDTTLPFEIVCSPSWVPALRRMAFAVDVCVWGKASILRILKYNMKGFDIYIPGRYDVVLKMHPKPKFRHSLNASDLSLAGLLAAEEFVMTHRRGYTRGKYAPKNIMQPRLTAEEFQRCVSQLKYASDYGILAKAQGRIKHIVLSMMLYGMRWFCDVPTNSKGPEPCYTWHKCDPKKRCLAMFSPCDPMIRSVFDMEALTSLLLRRQPTTYLAL